MVGGGRRGEKLRSGGELVGEVSDCVVRVNEVEGKHMVVSNVDAGVADSWRHLPSLEHPTA